MNKCCIHSSHKSVSWRVTRLIFYNPHSSISLTLRTVTATNDTDWALYPNPHLAALSKRINDISKKKKTILNMAVVMSTYINSCNIMPWMCVALFVIRTKYHTKYSTHRFYISKNRCVFFKLHLFSIDFYSFTQKW